MPETTSVGGDVPDEEEMTMKTEEKEEEGKEGEEEEAVG